MKKTWPIAIAILVLAGSIVFFALNLRYHLTDTKPIYRIDRLTGETHLLYINDTQGLREWLLVKERIW